ncbi:hypothetical protein N7501_002752 [Penicillium viridicatum]|nr:hypothetical protein N7501_002752 [Penicillium viridicatum]
MQLLLRGSSINAKQPSKAERIDKFRKHGITITSSDLALDSEEKLTPNSRNLKLSFVALGTWPKAGFKSKSPKPLLLPKCRTISHGGSNTTRWLTLATGAFTSAIFTPVGGLADVENEVVYGNED